MLLDNLLAHARCHMRVFNAPSLLVSFVAAKLAPRLAGAPLLFPGLHAQVLAASWLLVTSRGIRKEVTAK
jgi:hypothetical protein